MASISTGAHGGVEEAVSILNKETFTIDLKSLEQWYNGDKRLLPEEVIAEVLKQAHPHKAILFYLWAGQRCHNQMVRKLLDEGWYEKAVELLDDDQRSNQETYRMVISGLPIDQYKYKGSVGSAVKALLKHGYTLDPESFKKVYKIVGYDDLIECYKHMVAECSTAPDEEVCQFVLSAMVTEVRFEEACELVKYMVASGFKPGLQTLFKGLVRAGMSDDTYKVLETVDDEGAHNDLIRALGFYHRVDKVGELVERMLARGYTPYMRPLFDGLLEAGRDKDAYAALEMVGGEEAHCDFISALFNKKRTKDAYQFVKDMIGSRHPQHVVEKCLNTLVHELFEYCPLALYPSEEESAARVKMLLEAFELMEVAIATAGNITPDTKSYIAVACTLEKSGRTKEALYFSKFANLELIAVEGSCLYRRSCEFLRR